MTTHHLSEFLLDALDSGVATPSEKASAEAHLATCQECTGRLQKIQAGFAAFPGVDERALLAKIRTRADARQTSGVGAWLKRYFAPLALVTAVAVAVVFVPRDEDPTLRMKGAAALHVYVDREGTAVELTSGQAVQPGQALRFTIDLEQTAWVTIVGVEASGTLYRVFPRDSAAAQLAAGRQQALPGAVALDEAPGSETLHLVTCPAPPLTECTSRGAAAAPACSKGCTTSAFVVKKGP